MGVANPWRDAAPALGRELPMDIVESSVTTLRALGKDETWLHDWIMNKPARLGLGDLSIKRHELVHYKNKGGRLDMLGYRGDLDTYYEIEVMLGECDSDHGFRALDYWARERVRNPNVKHFAVIVAEDLSGRYQTLIETLAQFLPLIGIGIRTRRLQHDTDLAIVEALIVAQPDDLVLGTGDALDEQVTSQPRDRDWWESKATPGFLATVDSIAKFCDESVGPSRIDYSAQSYISLKKGRRCWLPMWPRKEGVFVYLPGGDGGSEDSPNDFFTSVRERLEQAGLETPSWTYKYNAGANPIAFALPLDKASHSLIREILKEAYELA
jgi:hypothetical protein